jgi:Na+/H+ antiporter NhaD/arsenite permease-like protein
VGASAPTPPRGEQIGFWGFTRIGAPFALVSLIVASFYIWLRYFAV